ncbi:MAG: hypothetical protein HQK50_15495 [Oligoflexia bacterium]|nr:hypothetical protein [Oligoflexia bacterium]MBF0366979.1 hypothetical protein [Oligoflexia bacterium]
MKLKKATITTNTSRSRRLMGAIKTIIVHEVKDVFCHPTPILMRCLTMPIYVVTLASIWNGLRSKAGLPITFPTLIYFVLTQTMLDSFVSRFSLSSLVINFEAALTRPIPWSIQSGAQAFARTSAQLFFMGILGQGVLALCGYTTENNFLILLRWFTVIPFIAFVDSLLTLIFTCIFLKIGKSDGLRFILSKSMLALGGGLYPLLQAGTWNQLLLQLPFADLIFQTAHFCLFGKPYGISLGIWIFRICSWSLVLILLSQIIFNSTRKNFLMGNGG